jgi:hypothetical protein
VKWALRGLLVLVGAALLAQPGAAARAGLHTVPYAGAFWNDHDGLLAVGQCRTTGWACGSGAVQLTTDGGQTYRTVFRTRRPVELVQTAGPGGAIVTTFGKRSWRTLDGGHTWLPWRPGVAGFSFATPLVGFGYRTYEVGNQERLALLSTSDGGLTWQRLRAPCNSMAPLLDRVTARLGWILCGGEPGAGNESKELFRTRNGGQTWHELAYTPMAELPRYGGISSLGYPAGMSFAPGGFGLMWEGRGTLYVTRNGGADWQTRGARYAVYDVDFGLGGGAFGDGTGFVLFQHGGVAARLVETRDFGRTWQVVHRWRG